MQQWPDVGTLEAKSQALDEQHDVEKRQPDLQAEVEDLGRQYLGDDEGPPQMMTAAGRRTWRIMLTAR